MRGASALEGVLEGLPEADLRVFVVWESVLLTDISPPRSRVLGKVSDVRTEQFWDRERVLARRIAAAGEEEPEGIVGSASCSSESVIWDWIAIYPAGIRWDGAYPKATFAGSPVLDVADKVRRVLIESLIPAVGY